MKLLMIFLIILSFVSVLTAGSYLIIIDASTSMDDYLPEGVAKIDAAKSAAIDFVDSSSGQDFAVMRFNGCPDDGNPKTGTIRVVQDFTTDKTSITSSINAITTGDYTPIAEAIAEGRTYVQSEKNGQGTIILLTDGEENCGGDPILEAQKTFQQGIAVINVVSYSIDESEVSIVEQHKEIARAGGGKYYTADNAAQLKTAFTSIKKEQPSSTCCLPLIVFGFVGLLFILRKNN
ncbi:MAG: VWA domain-containing protein [Candidatus Micrarchaeota archaeon]|nr:VWA domain-containing protein [Candidatus Micrarchaeota archaeon]